MKFKYGSIIVLLLVAGPVSAQQIKKGSLTDYYRDVPVAQAKISVVDTSLFVLSDSLGFFEIALFDDDYILIEAPGYRTLKVPAPGNTEFKLHLVLLKPPPESERFYSVVDEHATLLNGETLTQHILNSFQLWDRVNREGIKGRLEFLFELDEYGKVSGVKVLKGVTPYVDDEVLRILREARWRPARSENQAVKKRMRGAVVF